jgi:hypothetical protein
MKLILLKTEFDVSMKEIATLMGDVIWIQTFLHKLKQVKNQQGKI